MEYKRLTERCKEYIDIKCENCKQWKKFGNSYACMDITACDKEIINRLAELEDKIENGTLVEIPPLISYNEHLKKYEVLSYDIKIYVKEYCKTEAEAEKKLKELRGEV